MEKIIAEILICDALIDVQNINTEMMIGPLRCLDPFKDRAVVYQ